MLEKMNFVLQQFFRDISKEMLTSYGNIKALELEDFKDCDIKKKWLSMILVSGRSVKVSFKVFFLENDVRPLVVGKLGKDHITNEFLGSFMNEFSNVIAGRIRKDLQASGYTTKISLPLHTHILHGIEFFQKDDNTYRDTWSCCWQEHSIICSATLLAVDPAFTEKFSIPSSQSSSGAIEFF